MDSTFERLDREIREARSKLMGQEEALKSAMTQINEDVEGKLDRLELAPLKEYFGQSLNDVYTLVIIFYLRAVIALPFPCFLFHYLHVTTLSLSLSLNVYIL